MVSQETLFAPMKKIQMDLAHPLKKKFKNYRVSEIECDKTNLKDMHDRE